MATNMAASHAFGLPILADSFTHKGIPAAPAMK